MYEPEKNHKEDMRDLWEAVNSKISWKVFVFIISLVGLALGYLITTQTAQSSKIDSNYQQFVQASQDIASMRADISWIKQALSSRVNSTDPTNNQKQK